MNYRGSYRHLLRNAKAVIMAAIEIYNEEASGEFASCKKETMSENQQVEDEG